MKKSQAIMGAALAAAMLSGIAQADEAMANSKGDKCHGVAAAGKNDCASANGSHVCAGMATQDNAKEDWKYVTPGTCAKMGGKLKSKEKTTKM